MGPLEAISDVVTSGFIVAFNFFSAHPTFSGALTVLFGGSWTAVNVVRVWWPEHRCRPRGARAVVEVCGPFAAVLRAVLRRLLRLAGRGRPEGGGSRVSRPRARHSPPRTSHRDRKADRPS